MRIITNIVAAAMVLLATFGAGSAQEGGAGLQWAAGGQGSVNAEAALAASQALRQNGYEVFAVNSGGTIDSLLTLSSGELDLANVDAPNLRKVWEGADGFQQIRGFSQVMSGFTTFFFIIAPKESGIESVEDLAGKTLNGHTPGAVINQWNKDFVEALEEVGRIEVGSVTINQLAIGQAIDALIDGRVDAQVGYIFANELPGWLQQAMARGLEFRVIPVPEDVNEVLIGRGWQERAERSVGEIAKVDADLEGQEIASSGITTMVIARDGVPADAVDGFLDAFFGNVASIAAAHPSNAVYQEGPTYGAQYLIGEIPVHPGAAAFYKRHGVWNDALTVAGE